MSDIETTKTVIAIQGISVEAGTPSNNSVLTYVAMDEQWQAQPISQIDGYGTNEFTATGTIVNFSSTENVLGENTTSPLKEFVGVAIPNGSTLNLLASYTIPTGIQGWDVSVLGIDTNNGANVYKGDLNFITTNQSLLPIFPSVLNASNVIANGSATGWFPIATAATGIINIYGSGSTGTYWEISGKVQSIVAPYIPIPAFNPLDISDCILWLRPDMGITISTGVSTWLDQSTAGNSVYQSSSGQQPTFNSSDINYNNQPTISFNGSQTMFSSGSNTYGQPYTAIVIGHYTTVVANAGSIISVNQVYQAGNINAESLSEFSAYAGNTVYATGVSLSSPFVMAVEFNGSSTNIFMNDSSSSISSGDAGTDAWYPIEIGGNYGTGNFQGTLAEVIGYSRLLTTTELHQIFSYLGSRYGISAS